MIDSQGIYKRANNLVPFYKTRNILVIAQNIGIDVVHVDYFKNLLGIYTNKWKHCVMFLNNRKDEHLTLMFAGQKMRHDIYHRNLSKDKDLKEFKLFRI